ncbi:MULTISPECIES: hypothetical protein [Sphingomonadales]|uniref:NIPSNAP domain-containing protein n=2 Tax=Edaphosphingomonas TaxID=3423724 RepID=A0A2T4I506_9SPHN|nr:MULTISPECIES: hypothetical protein [Sphingomonas]AGH48805.1 hypothetical protein G432_05390 [Sphingomonas sp. MM-1]MDX3884175.1 hypothetical protein [Sphingomonas sp.]OHT21230.1 hypothetical protein BHE75_03236 [Sphingomonas haloaromaticamans]PTD24962.1 hypothetical protein CV103_06545 [Sphingomonas fennica]
MSTATTIYVIDEIVALPGKGRALLEAYHERYAPGARARGMALDRVLVSPPMWLDDDSNTITISWTIQGAPAWWGMSFQSRNDPGVADWWAEVDEMIVRRSRHFATAESDIAEICNV